MTDTEDILTTSDTPNRRLGPHKVPRIECSNCGTEHHIDAASGEYIGHCRECNAFLRRPTQAEEDKFADFIEWNFLHGERGDSSA